MSGFSLDRRPFSSSSNLTLAILSMFSLSLISLSFPLFSFFRIWNFSYKICFLSSKTDPKADAKSITPLCPIISYLLDSFSFYITAFFSYYSPLRTELVYLLTVTPDFFPTLFAIRSLFVVEEEKGFLWTTPESQWVFCRF